ncbi:hypothetical protein P3T76_004164 [Phytophthora citrophthora]|uniref:RxLR effector protein n=1 Tax=Phytophthora citrophthora TaxID=4793 RepID=A0AAD9GT48_9STRA|nr:hypothetical protein P3T76_004164 [Phytophthora citrophthora]
MRLTYIFAVTVLTANRNSVTAFPVREDSKIAIKNEAVTTTIGSTFAEGRMLRRMEKNENGLDDDDLDEERGVHEALKQVKQSAKGIKAFFVKFKKSPEGFG